MRRLAFVCLTMAVGALAAAPAEATPPAGPNGLVSFSRDVGGFFDIFTIPAGGGAPINLTNTVGPEEVDADWSANNRHLAYVRVDGGDEDIFLMNANGSNQVNLTAANTGEDTDPAFGSAALGSGPSLLAFSREVAPGNFDIFSAPVLNSGLGTVTNLTNSAGVDEGPDYSPDGTKIVFDSNRTGNFEIFVMNADGSNQLNLTNFAGNNDFAPQWSRDGKFITFQSNRNGGAPNIWRMNANGSGQVPLTTGTFPSGPIDFGPTYSGDSRKILFDRLTLAPPVHDELFTMNTDGSGQANLTSNPTGADITPDEQSIQTCGGKVASLVGDDGPDKIKGTKRRDVIDANKGKETVKAKGGNDLICLGPGKGKAVGGSGEDRCIGGKGKQTATGCERVKGIEGLGAIAKFK